MTDIASVPDGVANRHAPDAVVAMVLNRALTEAEQSVLEQYLGEASSPDLTEALDRVLPSWDSDMAGYRIMVTVMFGPVFQSLSREAPL